MFNKDKARKKFEKEYPDLLKVNKKIDNKTYKYFHVKKWRKENPEKVKAQRLLFCAIRNKTIKKGKCWECGSKNTQAHHEDYSKPLGVIWLCKEHHMEYDKNRRNLTKALSTSGI